MNANVRVKYENEPNPIWTDETADGNTDTL